MYTDYWQLASKPFEPTGEPPWYYPSEVHQGALLKLRYVIESRRTCAVLASAPGLGKSMLVGSLQRQLNAPFGPFSQVVFPLMPPRELLAYMVNELQAPTIEPATFTIEESLRRLELRLVELANQGQHAVLTIDEAQWLGEGRALETIRLLLNFVEVHHLPLTVLLVGQTSLLTLLDRHPGFEERLSAKIMLRPFTCDQTASYITHRLSASGARREIFTSEALAMVHELTGGNPRRINRLCDLALLVGFAEERSAIGPGDLEHVSEELVVTAAD
jgi:general secretion pathway protein A